MRRIYFVLFLFSAFANAQVNFSTYGAVGDGVADDTAALQAAFDSGNNLISDAGNTYLISAALLVTTNSTQDIDFNGSTLIRGSAVSNMLYVDKSSYAGTSTTFRNLIVDGNELSGHLVRLNSRTNMYNVDIKDGVQTVLNTAGTGPTIVGINISIFDEPGVSGQWIFDDVNIDNIRSLTGNGVIGTDSAGAARHFIAVWNEKVTDSIQIVYKNSSLTNSYGDDADLIVLNSKPAAGDLSFTNNSFWAENLYLANWQRRAVKAFMGNTTWINCDFYSAAYDNPLINPSWPPAGAMAIGAGSSSVGGQNHLVCGCNFYGPAGGNPNDAWYTKVIATGYPAPDSRIGQVEFRHCTFNGDNPNTGFSSSWTGVAFSGGRGSGDKVCGCTFGPASTTARGNKIIAYSNINQTGNKIQIDTNNEYPAGVNGLSLSASLYDLVDLSDDCPACPSIDSPPTAPTSTNMWDYDTANGGNNDGVIQDSEMQAAIDNEPVLNVDPPTTLNLSSRVNLDQIAGQEIDFNGSIIEKNFNGDYALYVNKNTMSNSITTLENFVLDGNFNSGSLLYLDARTDLTNAEVHSAVNTSGEPRGIWVQINDNVGARGEWLWSNVKIHDIRNDLRAGISQPTTGGAQGLYIFWQDVVSGNGTQFVMKDSEIYNIWGDEANGIIYNTQLIDISFTNNTLWFENLTIRGTERRAAKMFGGNQTWVNSNIYAVDRLNPNIDTRSAPAGLFAIGAGSSAAGAENNLVCGTTFHAAPTTPFDAWETQIAIGGAGGETSVEFRNSTFESGDDVNTSWGYDFAGIRFTYEIDDFKLCNSDFGIASTSARGLKLDKSTGFTLVDGPMQFDSNNTYQTGQVNFFSDFNSGTEYVISDLSAECDTCPTHSSTVATCNDGIQNGDETGIDCGGSCSPCATCSDGIQNQGETGVDCGGPCPPCTTSSLQATGAVYDGKKSRFFYLGSTKKGY